MKIIAMISMNHEGTTTVVIAVGTMILLIWMAPYPLGLVSATAFRD